MSPLNHIELKDILPFLTEGRNQDKSIRAKQIGKEEWASLVGSANLFRVSPYLYIQLVKDAIPVPEDSFALLKKTFLLNAARNMRLYNVLVRVLTRLVDNNIPVILLKGVFLAEAVYDNIGMRPMTDMDLLVHPGDVERAIKAMEGIGFLPERPYWSEVDGELHFHAPTMMKDGFFLELHWNLIKEANVSSIDLDGLWERALPFSLGKIQVKTLSMNDLVLHLAIHTSYGHQFNAQFLSLVDLKEIFEKKTVDIDWIEMAQKGKDWKAERGIYLTVRLVCELFDIHLPGNFLESIKPADWTEDAMTWAKNRLFTTGSPLGENYIRLMEGTKPIQKVQGLIRGLFPSRKVMAMVYGIPADSWRILAKYPFHIITRLKRYWKPFIQRIRGNPEQETTSVSDQALRDWLGVK